VDIGFDVVVNDQLLEKVKVNAVIIIRTFEHGAFNDIQSRRFGAREEGWIGGGKEDNGIAWLAKGSQRKIETSDHTRDEAELGVADLPVVKVLHALNEDFFKPIGSQSVPKDAMINALMESFKHTGRAFKIHICHPKRQDILWVDMPAQAFSTAAINQTVKIHISLR
jgi:hypothetical protein